MASIISSIRAWIINDNDLKDISLGSLFPNPGTETTLFSGAISPKALPYFTFICSAYRPRIEQPVLISSVIMSPPIGITAVWQITLL